MNGVIKNATTNDLFTLVPQTNRKFLSKPRSKKIIIYWKFSFLLLFDLGQSRWTKTFKFEHPYQDLILM